MYTSVCSDASWESSCTSKSLATIIKAIIALMLQEAIKSGADPGFSKEGR